MRTGEHVIYPNYGACLVKGLMESANGSRFYRLSALTNGMAILVPVSKANELGIRSVASKAEFEQAIKVLKSKPKVSKETWSKRYQAYVGLLQTGSVMDLAAIIRDLGSKAEMSFGERKMLDTAKTLFDTELELVFGVKEAV